VLNEGGLDPAAVAAHVGVHGTVAGFPGGETLVPSELWSVPCDLLVPAALGGVITAAVAERIVAPVVVEAANGPTTPAAEPVLDARDVVVIPDILANAGGVTASYFEWAQAKQGYAWEDDLVATRLRQRMERAFDEVWSRSEVLKVTMRRAAFAVGLERVATAIEARGLFP
jgi:glutamate dehydrogenase (NAD(P)+)